MEIGNINVWIQKTKDGYALFGNDYLLATFANELDAHYLAERSGIEIKEYRG